jgi:hypothetical protein
MHKEILLADSLLRFSSVSTFTGTIQTYLSGVERVAVITVYKRDREMIHVSYK